MIIIPFLNGYFIGNIPYFQTNPYIYIYGDWMVDCYTKNDDRWTDKLDESYAGIGNWNVHFGDGDWPEPHLASLDSRRVLSKGDLLVDPRKSLITGIPSLLVSSQSRRLGSPAQMLAKSCKIIYIYIYVYVSIKANLAGETNICLAEQKKLPQNPVVNCHVHHLIVFNSEHSNISG